MNRERTQKAEPPTTMGEGWIPPTPAPRFRRRWLARLGGRALAHAALVAVCCAGAGAAPARGLQPTEYEVKAQLIGWFAKLSAWPKGALPNDPEQPLVIGIMGSSPFPAKSLGVLGKAKAVGGRPIRVRTIASAKDAGTCHIVFIPQSVSSQLATSIHRALQGKPVLLIDDRVRPGAHVQFHLKGSVKFWIDRGGLKASGLRISTRLLKLAKKQG